MRKVFLNGRQIEFGELNIEWSLTVDEVEEISIETNGEFSLALADAIYQELGLGWLPYPENKPEEDGEYEITDPIWGVMMARYFEGEWLGAPNRPTAFRVPSPYQP